MSQQDLADAAGLSRPNLARLELGGQAANWETVVKLAEALGVPTDAFREEEEAEAPSKPGGKTKRQKGRPKAAWKKSGKRCMVTFDVSKFFFGDDETPSALAVDYWTEQARKGKPIPKPVVMEQENGRFRVVDGRARIEAAKRLGEQSIPAHVVERLSEESFRELRRALNQQYRLSN
jgi:transcriptional regulator with XRE-family HTH domain